jgi:cytochrome P450
MTDVEQHTDPPALADLFAPASRADPYPGYRRWRETMPVFRAAEELLVLTRHADCAAMLRDSRFGHGGPEYLPVPAPEYRVPDEPLVDERGLPVRSFLRLDPPDHTRLRRLVAKAFTPRMVAQLAPRIERITDELLDTALAVKDVDLIGSLAAPLPVIVISELLGVPLRDRDRFTAWSHAMARGLDPDFLVPPQVREQQMRARAEFVAYFRALIAERRRSPGDDLLSALVHVYEQGDVLTESELLATCVLLLIAGHETTVNLIGNGVLALLRNPEQFARLRAEPDFADRAVEELLRYDSPVQLTARVALQDADINGVPVPHGTFLLALIGSANRDPDAHPDPDRLDIGREPSRHLAFGQGIHFCLGAPLARLEGQIALRALVRRAPALSLAGEPSWKDNVVLRGMSHLPVTVAAR